MQAGQGSDIPASHWFVNANPEMPGALHLKSVSAHLRKIASYMEE